MTTLMIIAYIVFAIAHVPFVYKIMLDNEKLSDQEGFYLFTCIVMIPFYSVIWPVTDVLILLWIAVMLLADGVRWTAAKLSI